MRILHVINTLGKGGAEKLLVQTLPYYAKEPGWTVELLQITSRNEVPEYLEKLGTAGITIHTLGNKSVYHPGNVPMLRQFFKKHRYDLIHVHIFPAMYWVPMGMVAGGKECSLVFTEHNTRNRRWDKWYFKLADKIIYNKYRKIVAITGDVNKNLARWQPAIADRIVTIFNGIDTGSFKAIPPEDRAALMSSLSIPGQSRLLMMTARFDKQKNHRTIVEAISLLPANYYLLLAGEGPEAKNMEALAGNLGVAEKIKFLGFRTDVLCLMKTVDLNILSSNYEGLSGVTLEALCSGKPFLGSDVTGIQNVVPDKRFLFENNNAAELAEKIKHITEDPVLAAAMTDTSHEFVKTYDISKMIAEHIALYTSLQGN